MLCNPPEPEISGSVLYIVSKDFCFLQIFTLKPISFYFYLIFHNFILKEYKVTKEKIKITSI